MSYDIFENYYKKLLEDCLDEKMSPEDEHDSAILKSIIDKTYERTNAALTPEEKEVLKKYNLDRYDKHVLIPGDTRYYNWSDAELDSLEGGNKRERGHRGKYRDGSRKLFSSPTRHDRSQVNYADIARKRPERHQARLNRLNGDKITEYREAQRELRNAIWHRDYHQEYIDTADKSYFDALQKAKAAYDKAVKDANDARDKVDTYHSKQRDYQQKQIDSIYNKFKK